jgi:hypothetical protein
MWRLRPAALHGPSNDTSIKAGLSDGCRGERDQDNSDALCCRSVMRASLPMRRPDGMCDTPYHRRRSGPRWYTAVACRVTRLQNSLSGVTGWSWRRWRPPVEAGGIVQGPTIVGSSMVSASGSLRQR